jgi:hypothetical protein
VEKGSINLKFSWGVFWFCQGIWYKYFVNEISLMNTVPAMQVTSVCGMAKPDFENVLFLNAKQFLVFAFFCHFTGWFAFPVFL